MNDQSILSQSPSKISDEYSLGSQKYGGLIKAAPLKLFRRILFSFFNYTYSISRPFKYVHIVVTVIRVFQLLMPTLLESAKIWDINGDGKNFVNIISIFYHIIPPSARYEGSLIMCWLCIGFSAIFVITIIISAFYFDKKARLHPFIPNFIVFSFASVNFIMHPIACYLSFEMVSAISFEKSSIEIPEVQVIIVAVLVAFFTILFFILYMQILSQTLNFVPISMITVIRTPATLLFINVNVINLTCGLIAHAPKLGQVVMLVIISLVNLDALSVTFIHGGFVKISSSALIFACSFSAFVLTILMAVMIQTEIEIGLYLIFGLFVLFILTYYLGKIIFERRSLKHYILLDKFQEEGGEAIFSSLNSYMAILVDGMRNAHPVCVSGDIFKHGIELWNKKDRFWFIFAKFAAIYPEDTQTLTWIFHSIKTAKLKGITARAIKEQLLSILKQREANLSPYLKSKLNEAQKKGTSSKRKLRLVWDLAIQGNVNEMESSIKRFCDEMRHADSEYKHLLRQYPNNRFITRSYSRFCKEVKADNQEYSEYVEKTKLLHRGVFVNEDLTHKYGTLAFPNLPQHSILKKDISLISNENQMFTSTEIETEDDLNFEERYNGLKDIIKSLKIPSTRCTKMSRVIILVILYLIPCIILFITSSQLPDDLGESLKYMSAISDLSGTQTLVTIFNTNYLYMNISALPPLIDQGDSLNYLGGSYDIRNIVLFLVSKLVSALEETTEFRSYSNNDINVKKAQDLAFGSSVHYRYYDSFNEYRNVTQSIQISINDLVTQVSSMVKQPLVPFGGSMAVNPKFINSSYILNPVANIDSINQVLSGTLDLMNAYLRARDENIRYMTTIIQIAYSIIIIVSFIILLTVNVIWINSNKLEAYRCLTSLPKNVVSTLVENCKILKNEEGNDIVTTTDTDVSKQEDNIMKILVACGETRGMRILDQSIFMGATMIIIVLCCLSGYFFTEVYRNCSKSLYTSAPQLYYITTLATQSMLCFSYLQIVNSRTISYPTAIYIFTLEDWIAKFNSTVHLFNEYYHIVRFGGIDQNEPPFVGFQDAIDNFQMPGCEDKFAPVDKMFDFGRCLNIEDLMIFIQSMQQIFFIKSSVPGFDVLGQMGVRGELWNLMISPVYDKFFGPILDSIVPTIKRELNSATKSHFPVLIVFIFLVMILEIIALVQVYGVEDHIRDTLMILLHVPYATVMSTPKIVSVISGDFSKNNSDLSKINSELYTSIFKLLPDAILICDQDMKISFASKYCAKIFKQSPEELVGQDMKELLNAEKFGIDINNILKSKEKFFTETKDEEGSMINLDITCKRISNKYAVVMSDITNTVRYNQLIQDELRRSDELLSTILPPSLVPRVQAGEKNISFSVKSATIVFMDIVSFTPWCGSLPANKVMSTLNLLFKKIDFHMNRYPTMTKIKCIGDCYMAAGGIFSEINNPAEHAKEVVNFGLDSLEAIKELDEELEEKLQMRVGINTGGPIVAGVLGIGKPTFEILGPAINMAQQMEHHGVAMKVHISRPVYELIYGESFKIKERGSIEVKNGSVITYLVEKRIK